MQHLSAGDCQVAIESLSPLGDRTYEVEAAVDLNRQDAWVPRPDAFIRRKGDGGCQAACAWSNALAQFYRIRVRP